MRLAIAALLVFGLAGCAGTSDTNVGHYAYLTWNTSIKQCTNNVCTYGSNAETLESTIRCGSKVTISWDTKNWIHGSLTFDAKDSAGTNFEHRTLSSTTNGSKTVEGMPGDWTLRGTTKDANGNLEVRLTCH